MSRLRQTARNTAQLGIFGRLFATLFCLAFLAAGLLVGAMMARDVYRKALTYSWKPVQATIVSSDVRTERKGNDTHVFAVRYQYLFNGREHTSEKVAVGYQGSSDYTKAQRLVEKYPADATALAYVNPRNPGEAVLERSSLWMAFGLLFPIPFILIGAGGIYFVWRGDRAERSKVSERKAISEAALMANKPGCMVLFFAVFLIAGGAAFAALFVRPVINILQAKGWEPTPCVVISSQVRSHDSDDGTTYSVDILYSYEVKGKEYKANRYHFMTGSSSGYKGKAAIVRRHPPGTETMCFVNPNDPTEAVLERGFTKGLWLGLIPLVFVAAGAGGIFYSLRKGRQQRFAVSLAAARRTTAMEGISRSNSGTAEPLDGPVTLKAKMSPATKLLGTILVAVFWNGIVSVFLFQVVNMWRTGQGGGMKWFLTLFLIPFVVVGLGMLAAVGHSFIALFNPRPQLTASARSVPLGGTLELNWRITGNLQNIRELRIFLEGREEATYRRGTSTATDSHVFETRELVRVSNWTDMRSGSGKVTFPADSMHTFLSEHNKVIWVLRLKGNVEWRPDLDEEFPITVLPLPAAAPLET